MSDISSLRTEADGRDVRRVTHILTGVTDGRTGEGTDQRGRQTGVCRQTGVKNETGVADRPVGAGPDAGRRVALGVVLHRPGHVTPELRQVGRQLQHSVDGAHEHLARPAVDGEVSEGGVERPVHHPA